MKVRDLFENELLPPKVVAVAAARFFHDVHLGLEKILKPMADAFSSELNFDVEDHPNLRPFVTFKKRGQLPPKSEIRALVMSTAKKYRLQGFKPLIQYERHSSDEYMLDLGFTVSLGLDEDALEAAEAEIRRLGMHEMSSIGSINY